MSSTLFPTAPVHYDVCAPTTTCLNSVKCNNDEGRDFFSNNNENNAISWDESIVVANKSRINTVKCILDDIIAMKNRVKEKIKTNESYLKALQTVDYALFSVEPPLAIVGLAVPVVSLVAVPALLLGSTLHLLSHATRRRLDKRRVKHYANLSLLIQTFDDLSVKVDRIFEDNIVTTDELKEIKSIREKLQRNLHHT